MQVRVEPFRALGEFVNPTSLLDDAEKGLEEGDVGESRSRAEDDELGLRSREANVDSTPVFEEISDLVLRRKKGQDSRTQEKKKKEGGVLDRPSLSG